MGENNSPSFSGSGVVNHLSNGIRSSARHPALPDFPRTMLSEDFHTESALHCSLRSQFRDGGEYSTRSLRPYRDHSRERAVARIDHVVSSHSYVGESDVFALNTPEAAGYLRSFSSFAQSPFLPHGVRGTTLPICPYQADTLDSPPTTSTTASPCNGSVLWNSVMKARGLVEELLMEYRLVESNPTGKVSEVLQAALTLIGQTDSLDSGQDDQLDVVESQARRKAPLPVILAHPDEFKNPSSFLKIYGDPLCFSNETAFPKKGKNGNWECSKCQNVNYPRRFRCNKCSTARSPEGDRIVGDYTRHVYSKYLLTFSGSGGTAETPPSSPA